MKKLFFCLIIALVATSAFGQKPKLVVPPFENRRTTLDMETLENMQDYLINAFINNNSFEVPDRNALAALAAEHKFQLSDWSDDQKSAQMGKVLNADYIVRVIAMYDGEYNILTARILDVNTARGLSAAEMEFTSQREARNKMANFVEDILKRIGGGSGASTLVQYKIGGTGPGGGLIFFLEGRSGMEVSRWLGALDWNTAVSTARNFDGGGFRDWRLPSVSEMLIVYNNLQKSRITNLIMQGASLSHANSYYWTTETTRENPAVRAIVDFNNGNHPNWVNGTHRLATRAIRNFTF